MDNLKKAFLMATIESKWIQALHYFSDMYNTHGDKSNLEVGDRVNVWHDLTLVSIENKKIWLKEFKHSPSFVLAESDLSKEYTIPSLKMVGVAIRLNSRIADISTGEEYYVSNHFLEPAESSSTYPKEFPSVEIFFMTFEEM